MVANFFISPSNKKSSDSENEYFKITVDQNKSITQFLEDCPLTLQPTNKTGRTVSRNTGALLFEHTISTP